MTNPVDRWSEASNGWLRLDGKGVAFGSTADAIRELIAGYPQQDPDTTPCPTCGAEMACDYDDEGRPLIHRIDPVGRS